MTIRLVEDGSDVLLPVKAVPGASGDAVSGLLGDRLKVRISAPPEGGKANRAIERLLAGVLDLRPACVRVESGHGSPEKLVRIIGLDPAAVMERFGLEP